MKIETNKVINLNKTFGGILINRSNLEFAIEKANKEENIFKKSASIIRGIVVNHPFLDGNKRTAINLILENFRENKYKCDKNKLERGIISIAKQNQGDINKTAMRIRKWCIKK